MRNLTKLLTAVATLALPLWVSGCACSAIWHGNERVSTELVVRNDAEVPVCGFYIWRPQDAGGTGVVASSPELNNLLRPGTYLLGKNHPSVLRPGEEMKISLKAGASDRFNVAARDCGDEVIYEQQDVCLRSASPLRLAAQQ